jgi:hypothetical protein
MNDIFHKTHGLEVFTCEVLCTQFLLLDLIKLYNDPMMTSKPISTSPKTILSSFQFYCFNRFLSMNFLEMAIFFLNGKNFVFFGFLVAKI